MFGGLFDFFKNLDIKNILYILVIIIIVGIIGYYIYKTFFSKNNNEKVENSKNTEHMENRDVIEDNKIKEPDIDYSKMVDNLSNYPFFDIMIGDKHEGRLIFQLFDEDAPRTCLNFRHLCGRNILNNGKKPSYQGVEFHRIIPNFMIQGGDITRGDGTGGMSIYGEQFEDENLGAQHNQPGLLSMANAGPNTNSSQFFITTTETPHLDGKHTIFGIVLQGMDIIRKMESIETDENDRPKVSCKILKSGLLTKREFEKLSST